MESAVNSCSNLSIDNRLFLLDKRYDIKNEIPFDFEKTVDMYTQATFKSLIQENKKAKLPYFLVTWDNPFKKEPQIADAVSFMRQAFKFNDCLDPLTRKSITAFKIYKSKKLDNYFKFFCDEKTIRMNNDYAPKFINACDLGLEKKYRGEERCFLAQNYEHKAYHYEDKVKALMQEGKGSSPDYLKLMRKAEKYYDKAVFWLKQAVKDENLSSYVIFAKWHYNGAVVPKPSSEMGLIFLKRAAREVSDNDPRALQILEICVQMLKLANYQKDDLSFYINRFNALIPE